MEKRRISTTMTQDYVDCLNRLIEAGIYLHRGQIILEGLRYVFRGYGLAPFKFENPDGLHLEYGFAEIVGWREKAEKWDKAKAGRDYIILGIDEHKATQRNLESVRDYIGKLRDQAEKSEDIFERGFCKGIADALESILEVEGDG